MSEDYELRGKMQVLMYALTKHAARNSYMDFLNDLGISEDEYDAIKEIWADKLGVVPYV